MPNFLDDLNALSQSNRGQEKLALEISSFSKIENEEIQGLLQKHAKSDFTKTASELARNPFKNFDRTKHLVTTKFGVSDQLAQQLASTIITKADELHNRFGGEYEDIVQGIVENMDQEEIKRRTGSISMRPTSKRHLHELLKKNLIQELGLSSYEADRVKLTILQQAKNLYFTHRQYSTSELAMAILKIVIDYGDPSIAYGIATNDTLKEEIDNHLS